MEAFLYACYYMCLFGRAWARSLGLLCLPPPPRLIFCLHGHYVTDALVYTAGRRGERRLASAPRELAGLCTAVLLMAARNTSVRTSRKEKQTRFR